jgi:hypothetical protein
VTRDERQASRDEFNKLVNMTETALRRWLDSDDSQSVGMTPVGDKVTGPDQPEGVGHHMGERVLKIKQHKTSSLDDDDYRDMRKVVGYIHRHLKQRPKGSIEDSRWRKSLMNWGHDPVEGK